MRRATTAFLVLMGPAFAWVGGCGGDGGEAPDAASDASAPDDGGGDDLDAADAAVDTADASPPGPACLVPSRAVDGAGASLIDPVGATTVAIADRAACRRTFTLTTTTALRDGRGDNPRTVVEADDAPTTRTGNDLFDALYALAWDEVREDSAATVVNGDLSPGQPVPCGADGCFLTGELWTYVWTRDTAYATHLGLALADPARAASSLRFKLSPRRDGTAPELVQDTGSGGSWPVSTDRVVWALGARAVRDALTGERRADFAAAAREALANTVERDRDVVFDPATGLYRGETSFLDWREQTYPLWTRSDVAPIAASQALSTNVAHLEALRLLAELEAAAGDPASAARHRAWAEALATAIHDTFWREADGLFASFRGGDARDPVAGARFDLLGNALAVLAGVATAGEAARIVASWPVYGPGPPVVWPEDRVLPVYHNRAEWPFVTAYALRAAARVGDDASAARAMTSLFRAAALNLSNMENLEAGTGATWFQEGSVSGPVVCSRRQLWSVGAYLSLVQRTLFGLDFDADGLTIDPFLPAAVHAAWFAGSSELVLNDLAWHGRRLSVVLHLPAVPAAGGGYRAASATLDGAPVIAGPDGRLRVADTALQAASRLDVTLAPSTAPTALHLVDPGSGPHAIFAPLAPFITALAAVDGHLELTLRLVDEDAPGRVILAIDRDGERVADGLPGTATTYRDERASAAARVGSCYVLEARYDDGSRLVSQRSRPRCWYGEGDAEVQIVAASALELGDGATLIADPALPYVQLDADTAGVAATGFRPARTGPALLLARYGNGAGAVETGIGCALRRLVITDEASGEVVASGVLVMPQLGSDGRYALSTAVPATLDASRSYRVALVADAATVNMSAFAHFARYRGTGGAGGPWNRPRLVELRVLPGAAR